MKVKINLEALAKWAGTEFVCGEVVAMTLPSRHEVSNQQKLVHVKVYDESNCNGIDCVKHIPFDVISIDIGSTSRDFNTVPGASEFCISTRPISALVRRIEMEESLLQKNLHRYRNIILLQFDLIRNFKNRLKLFARYGTVIMTCLTTKRR